MKIKCLKILSAAFIAIAFFPPLIFGQPADLPADLPEDFPFELLNLENINTNLPPRGPQNRMLQNNGGTNVSGAERPAKIEVTSSLSGPTTVLDVLDLKNMDILDVLKLISQKSGLNIIAGQNVKGRITVYLRNIAVLDALHIIVEAYGWAITQENDIVKIMSASDYEAKFGRKFGQRHETQIKQLLYAAPADILAVLNQMKSAGGKVISDEKSNTLILIDEPDRLREMASIIARLDVPVETEVFELSYAQVADLSSTITEVLTPGLGTIKTDERSNKIVVTDTARTIAKIARLIEAFDQKDKQVLIESKIIQISLNKDHQLGINWEAVVSNYHQLTFDSDFRELTESARKGTVSIGTIAADEYTALVEALDTVGVTDLLASPKIAAVNNKEAKILVGSSQPYITATTTTNTANTTTAESINFIEVGVKLFVTPTIHNDGFITMKVKAEDSSVIDELPTSTSEIPIVGTSEAETTVLVKNGVTIVIGGLIEEDQISTTNKVPFLGDIPILGYAFKSHVDNIDKREIVIFLTPHLISGDVETDLL